MKQKKRIAVAMSGGVDSSVAALKLIEEGYKVSGFTFLAFDKKNKARQGQLAAARQAALIAGKLGIEHRTFSLVSPFKKKVIEPFCRVYFEGRTPNPCIRCNQYVKFGLLFDKVRGLGFDYLATGHYARITKSPNDNLYHLKKAADKLKDQSYFLYTLTQAKLKHILFPLGGLSKKAVRKKAKGRGLLPLVRRESQEICFIAEKNYQSFISLYKRPRVSSGDIVDTAGNTVGRHKGLFRYTVGQRRGLGISAPEPLYVVAIDTKNNRLIVGRKKDLYARSFVVGHVSSPVDFTLSGKRHFRVKIRYGQQAQPAVCQPCAKTGLKVTFDRPEPAITCGQSAVLYSRNEVIAGGIIEKVNRDYTK